MGAIMAIPEAFLKKQGVKNPKLVIFASVAIVLGITGFVIYKKIKSKNAGKYTSGRNYEEMTEQLANLQIKNSNVTLTDSEATIIAQNLFNAMNRWGTDEEAVVDNISKAKTKDDLYLITQKFGIMPYDGMGLADTWLSRQVAAVMKNLGGWIRSEVSGSNLTTIKEMYDKLGVPL